MKKLTITTLLIHAIKTVFMAITKIDFWDASITVNSFWPSTLKIARLAFIC